MSDNLTVTLPTDLEIKMVRVFDAPRARVFEAHTKCEHLKHWWGRGNPLDCELDFRPGGSYRFVEHAPDGSSTRSGARSRRSKRRRGRPRVDLLSQPGPWQDSARLLSLGALGGA